jgi:hypothetical protein
MKYLAIALIAVSTMLAGCGDKNNNNPTPCTPGSMGCPSK